MVANIITDLTDWIDDISAYWWFLLDRVRHRTARLDHPGRAERDRRDRRWCGGRRRQPAAGLVILAGAAGAFLGDNTGVHHRARFGPRVRRWAAKKPESAGRTHRAPRRRSASAGRSAADHRPLHPRRPHGADAVVRPHRPSPAMVRLLDRRSPAIIWASYAALLGYAFGAAFEDNHTLAFLLAFGFAARHHGTDRADPLGTRPRWRRHDAGDRHRDHRRDADRRRRRDECRPAYTRRSWLPMIASVPVRDGVLPAGADEAIAECGGRGAARRIRRRRLDLDGLATHARVVELGDFAPGAVESILRDRRSRRSPAASRRRSCCPNRPTAATSRRGWRPRSAGRSSPAPTTVSPARFVWPAAAASNSTRSTSVGGRSSPRSSQACAAPNPNADDRGRRRHAVRRRTATGRRPRRGRRRGAAARRRARWTSPRRRASSAAAPGSTATPPRVRPARPRSARPSAASMGATRVVTDRGWVGHERQIGTTGVVVDPDLYLAFGISGAVQHTSRARRTPSTSSRSTSTRTAR